MTGYAYETDQLTVDVTDHVATITLNRPDKRNAMSPPMLDALSQALTDTENDRDVRVVVLTGAGTAFCAGGDVSTMGSKLSDDEAPPKEQLIRGLQARQEAGTLKIFEHAKPTIAAMPGPAAGAGMGMALACDLRVGTPKACFVPAFGTIGLSGDWGGTWLMQRAIGPARAKEAYFTGERIYSDEGLTLGLFNRVFEQAGFIDAVQAFAAKIATGAPLALQKMKENHNRAMLSDLRSFMRSEAENMVAMMMTEDHKNAAAAFLAKTKPVFEGK